MRSALCGETRPIDHSRVRPTSRFCKNGAVGDELRVNQRLRRRRSPLLIPLIAAAVMGLGFVGWKTLAAGRPADDEPASAELGESEGSIGAGCLGPSERLDRLDAVERSRLAVAEPVLRSEHVVYGTIDESEARSDGAIEVSVRVDDNVSEAGRGLRWLLLPPDQPVEAALGVGTEFVALVGQVNGDEGTVVRDGFFFACSPADPASSYRFEQRLSLFDVEAGIATSLGLQTSVTALERSSGGPALRAEGADGSEIAVFLPEGTGLEFRVRSPSFDEPGLGGETWPILFSNGELVGRIKAGHCLNTSAGCSGPLRMEIESDLGDSLSEGFDLQVLRAADFRRVLGGALLAPSELVESENLLVVVDLG